MIRRVALALLATVGLVILGPALAANAAPAAASPVAAVGPLAMKACADAPEPASPLTGLPGKLFGKPATATSADPFEDPSVNMTDVYGYSYHWVNYDNGCVPGSSTGPGLTTGVANFFLAGSASMIAFTHGLFSKVVTPTFLEPLDNVLTTTTAAIKQGFWTPWSTIVLVIVAAAIMIAATRSDAPKVVTTTGWAFIVLIATTYVMSYPVSSAQAVDGLIQTTVITSAKAVGAVDANNLGPAGSGGAADAFGQGAIEDFLEGNTPANPAQSALDSMFDTMNRDTLYNTWLEGALGSSDSVIAKTYGPDLFRASHLTWAEAETVKNDPAAGRAIVDQKKELWTNTAAAVEREDSAAYKQLTGNSGRWDAAFTATLRVGLMIPFLMVAAVFTVIAYIVTRAFVPLAPAIGVFGMMLQTQGWVMSVLKNVGRFLILGPAFFVAALANLLLDTAILKSDLPFGVQLVICLAIPIILFKILRPGQSMPGARAMRRIAGEATRGVFTRRAVRGGIEDATGRPNGGEDEGDGDGPSRRDPAPYRYSDGPANRTRRDGPVASDPRELPAGRPQQSPVDVGYADSRVVPSRSRRDPSAPDVADDNRHAPAVSGGRRRREVGAGTRQTRPTFLLAGADTNPEIDAADARHLGPGTTAQLAGAGHHPALTADRSEYRSNTPAEPADTDQTDLAAPASTTALPAEILPRSTALPDNLYEANATTIDGVQVFRVWSPPGVDTAAATTDEEDYR